MKNNDKLESHFGPIEESQFLEKALQWEKEIPWKERSQDIALELWEYLDDKELTQKAFAQKMGVSPQVVSKWLKGQENFTLETISKLEAAIERNLIQVVGSPGIVTELIEKNSHISGRYPTDQTKIVK